MADYSGVVGRNFQQAWDNRSQMLSAPKKSKEDEKLREAFQNALRECDRAMENVMDRHHESVAKSNEKKAEYNKKKAVQEEIEKAALNREMLNEQAVIQRINYSNRIEFLRKEEDEDREKAAL